MILLSANLTTPDQVLGSVSGVESTLVCCQLVVGYQTPHVFNLSVTPTGGLLATMVQPSR